MLSRLFWLLDSLSSPTHRHHQTSLSRRLARRRLPRMPGGSCEYGVQLAAPSKGSPQSSQLGQPEQDSQNPPLPLSKLQNRPSAHSPPAPSPQYSPSPAGVPVAAAYLQERNTRRMKALDMLGTRTRLSVCSSRELGQGYLSLQAVQDVCAHSRQPCERTRRDAAGTIPAW